VQSEELTAGVAGLLALEGRLQAQERAGLSLQYRKVAPVASTALHGGKGPSGCVSGFGQAQRCPWLPMSQRAYYQACCVPLVTRKAAM
jgi:hypothetical protein